MRIGLMKDRGLSVLPELPDDAKFWKERYKDMWKSYIDAMTKLGHLSKAIGRAEEATEEARAFCRELDRHATLRESEYADAPDVYLWGAVE
jgi:hypothetical protein